MHAVIAQLAATLSACTGLFQPSFVAWAAIGLGLDALIGDPVFSLHPIRLLGRLLTAFETKLFRLGLNGYVGGILLFLLLCATVLPLCLGFLAIANAIHPVVFDLAAGLVMWACIALRDLIAHGERIARAVARGDLEAARNAISQLVGRDTDRMDLAACGRGAVESLSENLVDGVLSPLAFGLALGPLGAVLYKIVSTMDSMVGYKTPRYLRFGWCGARLDDVANYPFARWSAALIAGFASVLPRYSARKAWRSARAFHQVIPGPNSGWPEAAMAGALGIRLIGPIYKGGNLVADLWIGEPGDPAGASPADIRRSYTLLILSTLVTLGVGWGLSRLH